MKEITITEANRNFTNMIKEVEKEGTVLITKGNKPKYIVLPYEAYERSIMKKSNIINKMKNESLWGKENNNICNISIKDAKLILRERVEKDYGTAYIKDVFSLEKTSITVASGSIDIETNGYPEEYCISEKESYITKGESEKNFVLGCNERDLETLQSIHINRRLDPEVERTSTTEGPIEIFTL